MGQISESSTLLGGVGLPGAGFPGAGGSCSPVWLHRTLGSSELYSVRETGKPGFDVKSSEF